MSEIGDTPRTELPPRRLLQRAECEWLGKPCLIDIGFDAAGRAKEAFAVPDPSLGAELVAEAHGMAIFLSHELQEGKHPGAIAAALSAHPTILLYLMAQAAERLEAEYGPHIAALYAEIAARSGDGPA